MWAEVLSSAPHLQHKWLLVSPIKWRCLLRVLCTVRRPMATLDFVLLKNKSLVFAAGLGPEINSRACLWVLLRLCHVAKCHCFIFLLIFCLEIFLSYFSLYLQNNNFLLFFVCMSLTIKTKKDLTTKNGSCESLCVFWYIVTCSVVYAR